MGVIDLELDEEVWVLTPQEEKGDLKFLVGFLPFMSHTNRSHRLGIPGGIFTEYPPSLLLLIGVPPLLFQNLIFYLYQNLIFYLYQNLISSGV